MIEVTIRIQANSLEEALAELHTTAVNAPREVSQEEEKTQEPHCDNREQEPNEATPEEPAPQEQVAEIKPEEVRAILVKVREAGLDLVKILEPYGGRFPDVKKENYASLLKDAQNALSQAGNK